MYPMHQKVTEMRLLISLNRHRLVRGEITDLAASQAAEKRERSCRRVVRTSYRIPTVDAYKNLCRSESDVWLFIQGPHTQWT